MKIKKNSIAFWITKYKSRLCRLNRSTVRFITADPSYIGFLWITDFLWRKWNKAHKSYSIYFSTLHMCTNFYHNRKNNKYFFLYIRCTVPLTLFHPKGCHSVTLPPKNIFFKDYHEKIRLEKSIILSELDSQALALQCICFLLLISDKDFSLWRVKKRCCFRPFLLWWN